MRSKMDCEKFVNDIISLRRPTALDKLGETIPKPKGAVPNFGLPKWKVMPLESKIPMVPGPQGAYNFTRRKLGKELWMPSQDAEFNLSDPYCYEMDMPYDSLHDKHLIPYFSKPNTIRHLVKAGLVTKDLDANCSLRDYNMYRKYLRKMHCDSIKKELGRRERRNNEERAILFAQEQAEKEVRKFKEREKLMEGSRSIVRKRLSAEKLKLQKQREIQERIEEKLRMLMQKREEAKHLMHVKSRARSEIQRQKRKAAAEFDRMKVIQTLLDWSEKERARLKTRDTRLAQEREQKQQIIRQKWEEKQEYQKNQIQKEQFLMQCIENQRKQFIESYNNKLRKEAEKMQRLKRGIKMYLKCYMDRFVSGRKRRICCKKPPDYEKDENTTRSITRSIEYKSPIPSSPVKHARDKKTKETRMSKGKVQAKIRKAPATSKGKVQAKIRKAPATSKRKSSGPKPRKVKIPKRGKKGKRGKKRKQRRKKDLSSELEIDIETLQDTSSTARGTEISGTSTSTSKDMCRCQTIKDTKLL